MLDKKMSSESIFDSMLPLSLDQFINPTLSLNNDNNDDIYDYEEDILSSPSSTTLDFDKSYGGLDMSIDLNNSEDMYSEFNMNLLNSWQIHSDFNENDDVLNHDCMWAGHCESIEHAEETRSSSSSSTTLIPKPPVIIKQEFCEPAPVKIKSSLLNGSSSKKAEIKQESMLKSSAINNKSTGTTNLLIQQHIVPQTPPESDDEEIKAHRNNNSGLGSGLLNLLNEAINECDSDLTEYFESKEEIIDVKEEPIDNGDEELTAIKEELNYGDDDDDDEDEEEEDDDEEENVKNDEDEAAEQESSETDENMSFEEFRIRTQLAAENDHSYHSKSAVINHSNYGLDTPSDSEEEEEIDVVSVTEKFSINALPTNPSSKDRHQLQRRVATAISKTRTNNNNNNKTSSSSSNNNNSTKTGGLKTILPIRKSTSSSDTSSTISATPSSGNSRRGGVKRGRGASRNGNNNNNNRKRRKTTNNDEKEPPTDKRHLHNDMERQRRIDLRVAFDNLKAVVPEVSGTKKIAKVNILLQASQYCYYLTNQGNSNLRQIEEMRKKQSWLRNRVSQLRKNLASARR